VVLTHAHQDHVLLEHLLQLRYKIGTVLVPENVPGALQDPSLKLMLENQGFDSVRSLSEFERVALPGGAIQSLPFLGEHADLHIQSKLMHLITIAGVKVLFAADANNLDYKLYERVHEVVGDIDILFIGMECVGAPLSWLYQPLMLTQLTRDMDQSRRLDGSDFIKAKMMVETFNCKQVYVYAMGQEPWLNYVMGTHYTSTSPAIIESNKLLEYCKTRSITAARLLGSKTINIDVELISAGV
jgi:L-ascorbate metabolism protein UlaG (beta-lactamase superfamily)